MATMRSMHGHRESMCQNGDFYLTSVNTWWYRHDDRWRPVGIRDTTRYEDPDGNVWRYVVDTWTKQVLTRPKPTPSGYGAW